MTADMRKRQTHMSYKGELQTFTKLSMRHQVCPSETGDTTTSESTMLMSRGRGYILCEYILLISFIIQGAYISHLPSRQNNYGQIDKI